MVDNRKISQFTRTTTIADEALLTYIEAQGSEFVNLALTFANFKAGLDFADQAQVDTNTANIATNMTNIGINETAITTNTTNIGTNTTDIGTNATDIGTNATDIATNVTNIQTNTDAISALRAPLNFVLVEVLADLPTPSTSRIELLADTLYFFNTPGGSLNIGTDRLILADNTVLYSQDFARNKIEYSGNFTAIDSDAPLTSCAVIGIHIENTGAGSNSIGLNATRLTIDRCKTSGLGGINIGGTSVFIGNNILTGTSGAGTIGGSKVTFINNEFSGFTTGLIISQVAGDYLHISENKFEPTFTNAVINLISLSPTYNFIGIRDNDFLLPSLGNAINGLISNGNIVPGGRGIISNNHISETLAVVNISSDDVLWHLSGNTNLPSYDPYLIMTIPIGNESTTALTQDVDTVIAGTWLEKRSSDHFTSDVNGLVTNVALEGNRIEINFLSTIQPSGFNNTYEIQVLKNGSTLLAEICEIESKHSNDPGQLMILLADDITSINDTYQMIVRNITDDDDNIFLATTFNIKAMN